MIEANWLARQLETASARADKLPDWAKKEAGLPVSEKVIDADRIAWLNTHQFVLHRWHYPDGGPEGVELRVGNREPMYGATVEAVIDAARAKGAEGGR